MSGEICIQHQRFHTLFALAVAFIDNKLKGSMWSFLVNKHSYVYIHCLSHHVSLPNKCVGCISFHTFAKLILSEYFETCIIYIRVYIHVLLRLLLAHC